MTTIKVNGMRCQHCVSSITKALTAIAGVSDVVINLETAEVSYQATADIDPEKIKDAIRKIGFEPL
jgi:copper chaperone